jgi:EAL domain-containing protein (putative c-di-GMP-specific phosphodiesterase class I)
MLCHVSHPKSALCTRRLTFTDDSIAVFSLQSASLTSCQPLSGQRDRPLLKMSKPKPPGFRKLSCSECRNGKSLGFEFSMAFQPIINTETGQVYAYEALARGPEGQGAGWVFQHVNAENLYRFDQTCRVKAIGLAAELSLPGYLSINFMPNAVYRPELCIRTTLEAAERFGFPLERIMFEFTENEKIQSIEHITGIIEYYQKTGFITAIDDFGAGFSGLNLLADLQTDVIKIDMYLIRNIDTDRARQAIVRSIVHCCQELSIQVIAEGVETEAEWLCLRQLGITLYQGYLFAVPTFEALPATHIPSSG